MIPLVPVFFTVTLLAALVVFTNWLPNANGEPVSDIALPNPVRLTVFVWLKKPLELTVTLLVRFPEVVGTKYTYIVQTVPLAILEGQLSASLKFVPVEMLLMVTGPRALRVSVSGELVDPTAVNPKAMLPVLVPTAAKAVIPRTR